MAWFVLARVVFVAIVAYAAAVLHPLAFSLPSAVAVGLVLRGTLVIPQFVLKELQLVADSSDSMKRNRGRRGLDILQKIQKMSGVHVTISDVDFPDVREVDLKLIELARTLQGKIITNDFNLNKVAQLRGVEVLNVNELANSLKPFVLPG